MPSQQILVNLVQECCNFGSSQFLISYFVYICDLIVFFRLSYESILSVPTNPSPSWVAGWSMYDIPIDSVCRNAHRASTRCLIVRLERKFWNTLYTFERLAASLSSKSMALDIGDSIRLMASSFTPNSASVTLFKVFSTNAASYFDLMNVLKSWFWERVFIQSLSKRTDLIHPWEEYYLVSTGNSRYFMRSDNPEYHDCE